MWPGNGLRHIRMRIELSLLTSCRLEKRESCAQDYATLYMLGLPN